MAKLRLQITHDDFHCFTGTRIQQGEVSAGPETQGTILRSCVCVGFYHAESKVGAISHITGFSDQGGHSATGALVRLKKKLAKFGLALSDCECFMIGGAERARHVYDGVKTTLGREGLTCKELDILGSYHRKLLFDPSTGVAKLLKRLDRRAGGPEDRRTGLPDRRLMGDSGAASGEPGRRAAGSDRRAKDGDRRVSEWDHLTTEGTLSSDESYTCFKDPKRRLATGASVLFRNKALLTFLRQPILKTLLPETQRLHVWCAGCSVGMEVYSVAMVILDYLSVHRDGTELMVLGSDISDQALRTAQAATYGVTDQCAKDYARLLTRYAEPVDAHTVQMGRDVRNVVRFKQRDISVGSRRHKFELVICDHVLQYFPEDTQLQFVASLARAVRPGGYLYASTPTNAVRDAVLRDHPFDRAGHQLYRRRV